MSDIMKQGVSATSAPGLKELVSEHSAPDGTDARSETMDKTRSPLAPWLRYWRFLWLPAATEPVPRLRPFRWWDAGMGFIGFDQAGGLSLGASTRALFAHEHSGRDENREARHGHR